MIQYREGFCSDQYSFQISGIPSKVDSVQRKDVSTSIQYHWNHADYDRQILLSFPFAFNQRQTLADDSIVNLGESVLKNW